MTTETLTGTAYTAEIDRAAARLTIRLRANGEPMAQINGHLLPLVATMANAERHGRDGSPERLDAYLLGLSLGIQQAALGVAVVASIDGVSGDVALSGVATGDGTGATLPPAPAGGPYDQALVALDAWLDRGEIPAPELWAPVLEQLNQYGRDLDEDEHQARETGEQVGELHAAISKANDARRAESDRQ